MEEEDQQKFIDRLDKVCPNLPLFWDLWSITSAKKCPPLSQQNMEYVQALGGVCSAIRRLPTSAVPSELTQSSQTAYASGGSTDCWKGELGGGQVAIKSFRIYPKNVLEEATKVSNHSTCEARSQIKFPDYFETSSGLEETIPS